jgi:hypothetical protein
VFHAVRALSGIILAITEIKLNNDPSDIFAVVNGAVNVLAADVLNVHVGYRGLIHLSNKPDLTQLPAVSCILTSMP